MSILSLVLTAHTYLITITKPEGERSKLKNRTFLRILNMQLLAFINLGMSIQASKLTAKTGSK
jgi:hypothetical protein